MTNEETMFVVSKGTIQVGRDFVEAVTGTMQSHGKSHGNIELRRGATGDPMIYVWVSTLNIETTERVLRQCAAREGLHVFSFKSQAL